MSQIPFNRASIVGNELAYIEDAVRSGIISGEGHYTKRCEAYLEKLLGNNSTVLLTPSCTSALEMCAMLLDLQPEDEVILPSYTFVSTASAPVLRGVKPVFADIDSDSLNIDPNHVRELITPQTKAVFVVHYGGVGCRMPEISEVLQGKEIPVVEDAAHALGARLNGKSLGTFGALATFSFHETKNITCGEGGALVINDKLFLDRAHIIRDKGTNRKDFQKGSAPFYTWVDIGSSYVMSDVLAAFLFAQLEHIEEINKRRRELYAAYCEALAPLKKRGIVRYIDLQQASESTAHLFFILLESEAVRSQLQNYLQNQGIYSVFHYQPLHLSPFVEQRWGKQAPLPVTEATAKCLLRLPIFYSLTETQVELISRSIIRYFD